MLILCDPNGAFNRYLIVHKSFAKVEAKERDLGCTKLAFKKVTIKRILYMKDLWFNRLFIKIKS